MANRPMRMTAARLRKLHALGGIYALSDLQGRVAELDMPKDVLRNVQSVIDQAIEKLEKQRTANG